jgi:hypothetical protein
MKEYTATGKELKMRDLKDLLGRLPEAALDKPMMICIPARPLRYTEFGTLYFVPNHVAVSGVGSQA